MPLLITTNSEVQQQLLHVAGEYGTPTYVYFEDIIPRQCRRLRELYDGLPARLLYAMKANSNPRILQIIRDEGFGVETVSPAELILARRLGFDVDKMLFSANNMTDEEMTRAHEMGVLLNIGELSRLERYGRAFPGSEVCVRLNPQVGAGHHEHVITAGSRSKFGIPVDDAGEVRQILDRHGLKLVGLHQHIGSGILNVEDFRKAISVLIEAAPSFPDIRFINFGGGLGIPYGPDDAPLNRERFRSQIHPLLHDFRSGRFAEVEYLFEPGRYIVAESGILLAAANTVTPANGCGCGAFAYVEYLCAPGQCIVVETGILRAEATTVKPAKGRVFAGMDARMGQLMRPSLYGAYHEIANVTRPDGEMMPYDVTGNICESSDIFARDREIAEVSEGDLLAIQDAGAYGMSMASTYNLRPLPAEVLVTSGGQIELIRRRLTDEELVDELLAAS